MLRRITLLTLLILGAAVAAFAQQGNVIGLSGSGAPSGACAVGIMIYTDTAAGDLYNCPDGTWNNASAAGGADITTLACATCSTGDLVQWSGAAFAPVAPGQTVTTDATTSRDIGDCSTDNLNKLRFTSGSATAVTIDANNTGSCTPPNYVDVCAAGAGTVTITPDSGTINGAASLALTRVSSTKFACARLHPLSSGTDWFATTYAEGGGGSGAVHIFGGAYNFQMATNSVAYAPPLNGITFAQQTTEANARVRIPRTCTLQNLHVDIRTAQPGAGSLVITTYVNGVINTTLQVTIAAGSPAGVYSDTTGTIALTAGDFLSIEGDNNDTGASSALVRSMTLECVE